MAEEKQDERMDYGLVLSRIGRTPLVPIRSPKPGVRILGKAEWFNPSGSIKDRPARLIFETAIAEGRLTHEKALLDATSGNMGISYAMIGAALGYQVELCIPEGVSEERFRIARAYGARLVLTDASEGIDGAIIRARELALDKDKYYFADQFTNDANWRAHFETTGVEIWEQTRGHVTHLVAGVGTSGTLMGTARRLKEHNPAIRLVEVQPSDELQAIEGLKHMGTSIHPGHYEPTFAERMIPINTASAFREARRVAHEEGLFLGVSAAAALAAAQQLADESDTATIVVILPDGGDRYLSTPLWK